MASNQKSLDAMFGPNAQVDLVLADPGAKDTLSRIYQGLDRFGVPLADALLPQHATPLRSLRNGIGLTDNGLAWAVQTLQRLQQAGRLTGLNGPDPNAAGDTRPREKPPEGPPPMPMPISTAGPQVQRAWRWLAARQKDLREPMLAETREALANYLNVGLDRVKTIVAELRSLLQIPVPDHAARRAVVAKAPAEPAAPLAPAATKAAPAPEPDPLPAPVSRPDLPPPIVVDVVVRDLAGRRLGEGKASAPDPKVAPKVVSASPPPALTEQEARLLDDYNLAAAARDAAAQGDTDQTALLQQVWDDRGRKMKGIPPPRVLHCPKCGAPGYQKGLMDEECPSCGHAVSLATTVGQVLAPILGRPTPEAPQEAPGSPTGAEGWALPLLSFPRPQPAFRGPPGGPAAPSLEEALGLDIWEAARQVFDAEKRLAGLLQAKELLIP